MLDLGIEKKEYNGLHIFELASYPTTHATSCNEKEHRLWSGTFFIDRTEGSYRYGDEVQFGLWSRTPPKIKQSRAANDGYYRIEICLPKEDAIQLLEMALARLYNSEIKTDPVKLESFLQ